MSTPIADFAGTAAGREAVTGACSAAWMGDRRSDAPIRLPAANPVPRATTDLFVLSGPGRRIEIA